MKKLMMIGLVLIMTLSVTACGNAANATETTPTPTAATEKQKISVESFGTAQITRSISLVLPYSAILSTLQASNGQRFALGQELATLDIRDMQLDLENRKSQLATLEAEIARITDAAGGKSADAGRLRSELNSAESLYQKALSDLAEKELQYKNGLITAKELDAQKQEVAMRKKAVNDARYMLSANLDSQDAMLAPKIAAAAELAAGIALTESRMKSAAFQGDTIVCPIKNGLVSECQARVGDQLALGSRLMILDDLDSLVMVADVPEEFIKSVKIGQKAVVVPIADKSLSYDATVSAIRGSAINKNGQTIVEVELQLNNPDGFILPNFNVDVKIITE